MTTHDLATIGSDYIVVPDYFAGCDDLSAGMCAAWKEVDKLIHLDRKGHDAAAERNGMILAANAIFDLIHNHAKAKA